MIKGEQIITMINKKIYKKLTNKKYKLGMNYTAYLINGGINNNHILYQAYQGKSMTGNPYAVFKQLITDSGFSKYTHVWAMDKDMKINPSYSTYPNVKFVIIDSDDYLKYLSNAKYLINNTSFPYYFQKKKGQLYINTWHGTPLKTLGLDIKDTKVSSHSNIQRNLLHVDFLVAPNKFTYEKLLSSHDCLSLYNGKILDTGYPRVDGTLNTNPDTIRELLSVSKDKKIILYAPTWRGTIGSEVDTSQKLLDELEFIKSQISNEYVVLLKSHYYTYNYFKENNLEHLCVPELIDSNELLSAVDILITDYSSIFFDYLPTKRPVIFYADDFEEYEQTRGFYIDIDTLPGPICKNINQVITEINNIKTVTEKVKKNYEDFLNTYCYNDDGNSTQRFIDIIFKNKPHKDCIKLQNNKVKILMHCGSFLNNGITISAMNLLNQLDYDKYDVTITTSGGNHQSKKANLDKLNPNVKVIYRIGSLNKTLWEGFKHYIIREMQIKLNSFTPVALYKRELRRIIGNTKFDIGIDFGGYNILWSLLIAFGPFKKKVIYQHNDMLMEYNKIIKGKYKHRKNLNIIFSLYSYYDHVVSVSKSAMEANKKNLSKYFKDSTTKLNYLNNIINYHSILSLKEKAEYIKYQNDNYLILPKENSESILEALKVSTKGIKFINIGRLSPEKGQDKLIKAFSQALKIHNDLTLYIVGEGVLENQLKSLVKRLKITNRVVFTGQLENAYPLLDLCDCFILSSNYEGQGLVLLESLVLNKPTISTDVTGAHSVLEDGYGLLVENTIDGITKGMLKYIDGEKLSTKTFDYEKYNREALQMFYQIIES